MLNYRDLLTVQDGYGLRQKFPPISVSDGRDACLSNPREFGYRGGK